MCLFCSAPAFVKLVNLGVGVGGGWGAFLKFIELILKEGLYLTDK